jgi:molybdenum cofactor cytidylyltransferase
VISSILLCAGLSRRFGREKLSQRVRGKRVVDWCVENLLGSRVDEIMMVMNCQTADMVNDYPSDLRMKIVLNHYPEQGMSSSIQCGLRACHEASQAVLIALGDMPWIGADIYDLLISRWEMKPESIVVPRYLGQQGNPVVLPRSFWNDIHALQGDVGCKSILHQHTDLTKWVDLEDDRVLRDIDTVSDIVGREVFWND